MEREQPSGTGLQPVRPGIPGVRIEEAPSRAALPTATLRILLGLAWTANATLKWVPAFGAGFLLAAPTLRQ